MNWSNKTLITHDQRQDYNGKDDNGLCQCEDMCPEEEVQKRINENDIHKLEMSNNLRATMIKKFQRSSAGFISHNRSTKTIDI